MDIIWVIIVVVFTVAFVAWVLFDHFANAAHLDGLVITPEVSCAGDGGCATSISYRAHNTTRVEVFDLAAAEEPGTISDADRVFDANLRDGIDASGPLNTTIENANENNRSFHRITHHPIHAPGQYHFFIRVSRVMNSTQEFLNTRDEEEVSYRVLAIDETSHRSFTEAFFDEAIPSSGLVRFSADRVLAAPGASGGAPWMKVCGSFKLISVRIGKRELTLRPTQENRTPPSVPVPDVQVKIMRGDTVVEDLGFFPADSTRTLETPIEVAGDKPLVVRTSMTQQIEPVDHLIQARWDGGVTLLCEQKS